MTVSSGNLHHMMIFRKYNSYGVLMVQRIQRVLMYTVRFQGDHYMPQKTGKLIYAADDEENIRNLIAIYLTQAGYEVRTFPTGDSLLEAFGKEPCDLVVLDIMMPGRDGLEICTLIRKQSKVPIVILTAKEGDMDYITGLSLGGDDYIIKPFRPSIFVMRINALLRRVDMEHEEEKQPDIIACGDITYQQSDLTVRVNGKDTGMTMTERALIRYLMENTQKAVSRDELLRGVWGIQGGIETRVADETIRRVRKKLRLAHSKANIIAIWGFGYRLTFDGE